MRNNFNMLRLAAACFVFISHSFAVYGLHQPQLLSARDGLHEIDIGTIGVSIFFVMSGYLVTQSWIREPKFEIFLKKRILRIYPAVIMCMLVVSLLIGAVATTLPIFEYYKILLPSLPSRMIGILSFAIQPLAGVFTNNPIASIPNTPLWTLQYEALCYFIIALCGILLNLRKSIPLITAFYFLGFWSHILMPHSVQQLAYMFVVFFMFGSIAFLYLKYIPLNHWLAILSVAALVLLFITDYYAVGAYIISVFYLTLYVALKFSYLGNGAKYGDFSYGIYIYAWPVQQSCAMFFGFVREMFSWNMAISFFITLILAACSWHFIERPALKFKAILK
jgi:peptidoglycan/LPS O-acetylase OafA/YrhL